MLKLAIFASLQLSKERTEKHKRDAKSRDLTCGVAQDEEVNYGRSEAFSRWSD